MNDTQCHVCHRLHALLSALSAFAVGFAFLGLQPQDANASTTQPPGLFPFVMAWDPANSTVTAADDTTLPRVTDVSHWIEKPAGARGFISADGARFYAGDKPIRFFGTNIAFAANFPYHADSERLADRLARFGINSVRFHQMDVSVIETMADGRRRSIWNSDMRTFSPVQLDRFDYLFAQLKARGIYGNLNLHVSRNYPGFPSGAVGAHKGIDIFFRPMIEMQKQYARDLLHHTNPYTGLRYVDDPALAVVEINNENSLLGFWWRGTMDNLHPLFADDLRAKWNAWLVKRYGSVSDTYAVWWANTPAPEPLGAELIGNPTFSDPTNPLRYWTIQNMSSAPFLTSGSTPPPGIELNTRSGVPNPASAVFFQTGHTLTPGQRYTLMIDATAINPYTLTVQIMDAGAPYRAHFATPLSLTATSSPLVSSFVYKDGAPGTRLRLNLAGFKPVENQFRIEKISLRQGGSPADLELLDNGEIEFPTRGRFENYAEFVRNDWLTFLFETERAYWHEMRDFLRNDLQVRVPIIGTQLGVISNFALQQDMDAIDSHGYWQHPLSASANANDWTVANVSMVGDVAGGYAAIPSLYRVAGRPYFLTEYNHCSPNTYAAEAFPIITAYGAFQDWTGIYIFNWANGYGPWDKGFISGNFDIDQHPLKLATLPIASALFLRGDSDAHPSLKTQVVPISTRSLFKKMDQVGPDVHAETVGGSRHDALRRPYGIKLDDSAPDATPPPKLTYDGPITSEGGALTWDAAPGAGIFTLRTERTKAAIGFARGRTFDLDGVTVTPGTTIQDWSTIAISQIDGKRIGSHGRALLVACGYMENTLQVWKTSAMNSIASWGQAPTLVEGVPASITIDLGPSVAAVEVWALDQSGRRAQAVPVTISGETARFNIGPEYRTIWYEVVTSVPGALQP